MSVQMFDWILEDKGLIESGELTRDQAERVKAMILAGSEGLLSAISCDMPCKTLYKPNLHQWKEQLCTDSRNCKCTENGRIWDENARGVVTEASLYYRCLLRNVHLSDAPREKSGKQYLHEIVANGRNGLDVDKFDYLRRDAKCCGVRIAADIDRLRTFSKVHLAIAYPMNPHTWAVAIILTC